MYFEFNSQNSLIILRFLRLFVAKHCYESIVTIYSTARSNGAFDRGDCTRGRGGVQVVAGFAFAADRLSDNLGAGKLAGRES